MSYYSYKKIINVAIPIIISGIAQNIVSVTDTIFLSRLNENILGAAGNAGIFYFFVIMIAQGWCIGAQILMAKSNGAKEWKKIGSYFDQTLIFLLPVALILLLIFKYVGPIIFSFLIKDTITSNYAIEFLSYRKWGVFFALLNFLFIAFYVSITNTKLISVVSIIMSIVNIILDYLLIFGKFGFPEMGIKGAAIASVIAEGLAVLIFILSINQSKINTYGIYKNLSLKINNIIDVIKMGTPVSLQFILSIGSWFSFFMFIEKLGTKELASAHIVRSIYMVLMIPLFGFSNTTNTLVGNLIGAGFISKIPQLIKRIILLCLGFTLISFIIINLFPESILSLYTSDNHLMEYAKSSLFVIGFTMFFFSVAFIFFNVILGAGKTKLALLIESITIIIYLSVVYLLTIVYPQKIAVVWTSEFVYFGVLGCLSYFGMKRYIFKKEKI